MRHAHFVSPWRLFLPFLCTASLTLVLTACDSQSQVAPQATAVQAAREYTVRGVVRQVAADGGEITIHHEAVPEFVGISGETEAMDSMSMPFPVVEKLLLEGIAAGDKVSFRFRIDWDGKVPLSVVALEKLPAETELDFEKGSP